MGIYYPCRCRCIRPLRRDPVNPYTLTRPGWKNDASGYHTCGLRRAVYVRLQLLATAASFHDWICYLSHICYLCNWGPGLRRWLRLQVHIGDEGVKWLQACHSSRQGSNAMHAMQHTYYSTPYIRVSQNKGRINGCVESLVSTGLIISDLLHINFTLPCIHKCRKY